MKKFVSLLVLLTLALASFLPVFAQQTPSKDDDDVVKISTNLIQIDATVTDKKGNIVTNLTADDFEIYENDEKQPITNFSFVELPPVEVTDSSARAVKPDKNALPLPSIPTKLRPEQVRRTIALVVDDLGLSFSSTFWVQSALKKFVDEQMQPGDLVAIIRTGSGMAALQQFTSDKRLLYAAIKKVRFSLNSRVGVSSFAPIQPDFKEELNASVNAATGESGRVLGTEQDLEAERTFNLFREDGFAVGTLGAVNYVVRGMGELPGRKAVMLFSEGFGVNSRIVGAMRNLAELANRSGTILYAVDPRGLVAPGPNAEDSFVGLSSSPFVVENALSQRDGTLRRTQQSLQYLTEETGGFAVINQNNINRGIERVLNDQKGFYLLGYEPDEETFNPKTRRFNKLEVRLKRPGLKIRYRSGFFGFTDSEVKAVPRTPHAQMLNALTSPFANNEINLKLNTFFVDNPKGGSSMETFVHVNSDGLKFTEDKNGWQKVSFEILAVIFGDNGTIIDILTTGAS